MEWSRHRPGRWELMGLWPMDQRLRGRVRRRGLDPAPTGWGLGPHAAQCHLQLAATLVKVYAAQCSKPPGQSSSHVRMHHRIVLIDPLLQAPLIQPEQAYRASGWRIQRVGCHCYSTLEALFVDGWAVVNVLTAFGRLLKSLPQGKAFAMCEGGVEVVDTGDIDLAEHVFDATTRAPQ